MRIVSIFVVVLLCIIVALVIAGQLGLLTGKQPERLGAKDGKLKPPSGTPNSVTSQAALYPDHRQKDYAAIEPIRFTGDGAAAMAKIADILKTMDRTVVVTNDADYIYAQCTTALLKFTDDVEFWLDKSAGVIQVRSSSRLGQKDFNVNRERVEAIRARFNGA